MEGLEELGPSLAVATWVGCVVLATLSLCSQKRPKEGRAKGIRAVIANSQNVSKRNPTANKAKKMKGKAKTVAKAKTSLAAVKCAKASDIRVTSTTGFRAADARASPGSRDSTTVVDTSSGPATADLGPGERLQSELRLQLGISV